MHDNILISDIQSRLATRSHENIQYETRNTYTQMTQTTQTCKLKMKRNYRNCIFGHF